MSNRVKLNKRNAKGQFEEGHEKIGGREKGTPNRLTRDIKEALVTAMMLHGEDGQGKDAMVGYFRMLAGGTKYQQRIFGALVGRSIPSQVNANVQGNVRHHSYGAKPIYESFDQVTKELARRGLPPPKFDNSKLLDLEAIDVTPDGDGFDNED